MKFHFYKYCLALALIVSAISCSQIEFERQDVNTWYDAKSDTLAVELSYHNLTAVAKEENSWTNDGFKSKPAGPDLEAGEKVLRRIAAGERFFMIAISFMEVDLENQPELIAEDSTPEEIRAAQFVDGVSMDTARVFINKENQLCAVQQLSVRNLSDGLALMNAGLRNEFYQDYVESSVRAEDDPLDEATIALFLTDVENGYDWARWTEAGLSFSIPASPELLAKLFLDGLAAIGNGSEKGLPQFLAGFRSMAEVLGPITGLTVIDNHVTITFGADADGKLSFHFPNKWDNPYESENDSGNANALRDHILQSDLKLPTSWKRE